MNARKGIWLWLHVKTELGASIFKRLAKCDPSDVRLVNKLK